MLKTGLTHEKKHLIQSYTAVNPIFNIYLYMVMSEKIVIWMV